MLEMSRFNFKVDGIFFRRALVIFFVVEAVNIELGSLN